MLAYEAQRLAPGTTISTGLTVKPASAEEGSGPPTLELLEAIKTDWLRKTRLIFIVVYLISVLSFFFVSHNLSLV